MVQAMVLTINMAANPSNFPSGSTSTSANHGNDVGGGGGGGVARGGDAATMAFNANTGGRCRSQWMHFLSDSCTVLRVFRQKFTLDDAIGPTPARLKRAGV
jgi:hypothetical protein